MPAGPKKISKELNVRITATDETRGIMRQVAQQAETIRTSGAVPAGVTPTAEARRIRRHLDRIDPNDRFFVEQTAGRRMRELGEERMEAFREAERIYKQELEAVQKNIAAIQQETQQRRQSTHKRQAVEAVDLSILSQQTRNLLRQQGGVSRAARSDMGDRFSFFGRSLGLAGLGEAGRRIAGGGFGAAAGGAIVTSVVGSALDRTAKAARGIAEQWARGEASAGQLVEQIARGLPLIGHWISAGREFRVVLDTIVDRERVRQRMIAEQIRDNRQLAQQMREQRDARRGQVVRSLDQQALAAEGALRVVGRQGRERAIAEAEVRRDQALRGIAEDEKQIGGLSPEQQERAREQIRRRRLAAEAQFQADLREVREQEVQREAAAAEAHTRKMDQIEQGAYRTRLEQQGMFLTARRKDIQDAYRQELVDIEKRLREETEDLAEGDILREAAQKRARESRQAADLERRRQLAQLEHEDRQRRLQAEEAHAQQVRQIVTAAAITRLRVAGDAAKAEEGQLKAALAERLELIRQNLAEQERLHAEQAPRLRQQAAEAARAETEAFAAQLEELRARRAAAFRPDLPGVPGGEVRGLTGHLGQAAQNPVLKPAEQTAKSAQKAERYLQAMDNKLGQLLTRLESGSSAAVW